MPDVLLCVLCRFGTGCSRHFFRIDSESRYDDHFFIDIVGVGDDDAVFTGRGISESQVIGVFSVYGHEIEMYTVEQGEKRDKRQ